MIHRSECLGQPVATDGAPQILSTGSEDNFIFPHVESTVL